MEDFKTAAQTGDQCSKGAGTAGALSGLVIVGVGVLLLLDNFGLFHFSNIWKLWPLWMVAVGFGKAVDSPHSNSKMIGVLIAMLGCMFLIGNLGWFRVSWTLFWGLALIGAGVVALLRPGNLKGWPGHSFGERMQEGFRSGADAASNWRSDLNRSSDWAFFGASKRRMDTLEYQGGEAFAMFGGVEIDLREAHLAEDAVVLDATAIFGGVEIRVPEDWGVSVRGSGIFGGYEDKTSRRRQDGQKPEHFLIVNGLALFGGVVVKY